MQTCHSEKSKAPVGPNLLDRRPKDECGIFAVYGQEEAAKLAYFGL